MTAFSWGNSINPAQANYDVKHSYAGSVTRAASGSAMPVGSYAPNAFGLYDMHGNVSEWVEDCYVNYNDAPADGSARIRDACDRPGLFGGGGILRGGSWGDRPRDIRSATRMTTRRETRTGSIGFRVARTD